MRVAYLTSVAFFAWLAVAAGCGGRVIATGTSGGSGAAGAGGSAPAWATCDGPGQCTLIAKGCCGVCGMPEVADYAAVNASQVNAFDQQNCAVQSPCDPCPFAENPNLFAFCDGGTCAVADTRTSPVGACSQDSDCRLRFGAGCCESLCSGTDSEVTAVNQSGELEGLVCGPHEDCSSCAPQYPFDAVPLCSSGQCSVGFVNAK